MSRVGRASGGPAPSRASSASALGVATVGHGAVERIVVERIVVGLIVVGSIGDASDAPRWSSSAASAPAQRSTGSALPHNKGAHGGDLLGFKGSAHGARNRRRRAATVGTRRRRHAAAARSGGGARDRSRSKQGPRGARATEGSSGGARAPPQVVCAPRERRRAPLGAKADGVESRHRCSLARGGADEEARRRARASERDEERDEEAGVQKASRTQFRRAWRGTFYLSQALTAVRKLWPARMAVCDCVIPPYARALSPMR